MTCVRVRTTRHLFHPPQCCMIAGIVCVCVCVCVCVDSAVSMIAMFLHASVSSSNSENGPIVKTMLVILLLHQWSTNIRQSPVI